MKGHQNKAERVKTGMQYITKAPKKKWLKNHPKVKFNETTRRYE